MSNLKIMKSINQIKTRCENCNASVSNGALKKHKLTNKCKINTMTPKEKKEADERHELYVEDYRERLRQNRTVIYH